ncbi:glycine-rich protein [Crocinitomix algicola]|uniref:glycine-rich protein n=1 Tax=Crocinitomix algicola TaxID=1740263 RepID=UPI0008727FC3|nr:glycine-rich protein [Crocinitomix algicola]
MKNNLRTLGLIGAFLFTNYADAQEVVFEYTGAVQTYVIPDGVHGVIMEAWGAQGGGSEDCDDGVNDDGGLGGYATGRIDLAPGSTLNIFVGGKPEVNLGGGTPGGFNGGGASGRYGGAGGGASDIRLTGMDLGSRLLVAGGGGGGNTGCPDNGAGGAGGGLYGEVGLAYEGYTPGTGGTQTEGGTGAGDGSDGAFGVGGTGGYHVAGGGGGFYGGGAAFAAGAGGGSSYYGILEDASSMSGANAGHGRVILTLLCDAITTTVSSYEICLGEGVTITGTSHTGGDVSWSGGLENGVEFVPESVGLLEFNSSSTSPTDCPANVEILVLDVPKVVSSTKIDAEFGGDGEIDITVSGGEPVYEFDWDNDGTGDFDDPEDLTGLDEGIYKVVIRDYKGCQGSEIFVLNGFLSDQSLSQQALNVYPNPTTNNIAIEGVENATYSISNLKGSILSTGQISTADNIDVSEFDAGLYFITIQQNNETNVLKFVKK